MTKISGVLGCAFEKGDILKDEEALKEVQKLGEQILKISENQK